MKESGVASGSSRTLLWLLWRWQEGVEMFALGCIKGLEISYLGHFCLFWTLPVFDHHLWSFSFVVSARRCATLLENIHTSIVHLVQSL